MRIIFEDQDLLVLDKPSGVTVNRSDTTLNETTVQDYAETIFKLNGEDRESEFYKRSGIVHRLDKDTSGVLLIAKNQGAFENLQRQFKEREVSKTYLALVHGIPKPSFGEISTPLGRLPWNRKRFGVLAGGREASTKYEVMAIKYYVSKGRKEPLSLLRVMPRTGRTHQIRVHLKSLGHPIFADELYAGRKVSRDDRRKLSRIFLHAAKISIRHPKTNQEVSFESKLPEDLKHFLDRTLESA